MSVDATQRASVHRAYEYRAEVSVNDSPDVAGKRLAECLDRAPRTRVRVAGEGDFEIRDDPPWFLAVAACSLALLAGLGAATALLLGSLHPAHIVLVGVWAMLALGFAVPFASAVLRRTTIAVLGERVERAVRFGPLLLERRSVTCDEVVAALVVMDGTRRAVVLVGPRNHERLTLCAERALDAPEFPRWVADTGAALVAWGCARGRTAPGEPTSSAVLEHAP